MSLTIEGTDTQADPLEGIRIVDCDAHMTEPPELWTSRVAASQKDSVPVQREVDGRTYWFLNDEVWASTGGNTIAQGGTKLLGTHTMARFEDIDRSAWSVPERLALMDLVGVEAQILYPNGVGFASNHVFSIEDVAQRQVVLQTFNDFYLDIQREGEGRLLPQPMLPVWDMALTVKEMTRLLDRGITGFTLSDKPEMLGLPELWEPYFDPMWDVFNESGAVANFHIGAGFTRAETESKRAEAVHGGYRQEGEKRPIPASPDPAWKGFGPQRRLAVLAAQMQMSNVRILVNLCMSDLFDRFPKLKIASAESGLGWVPYIFESLEFQFDEMVTKEEELKYAQRRPTEYFKDHISVMFWFEKNITPELVEQVGVNNILVETDIPHPVCLYPGIRAHFAESMSALDRHSIQRILQDNAVELYGITLR